MNAVAMTLAAQRKNDEGQGNPKDPYRLLRSSYNEVSKAVDTLVHVLAKKGDIADAVQTIGAAQKMVANAHRMQREGCEKLRLTPFEFPKDQPLRHAFSAWFWGHPLDHQRLIRFTLELRVLRAHMAGLLGTFPS